MRAGNDNWHQAVGYRALKSTVEGDWRTEFEAFKTVIACYTRNTPMNK